MDSKKKNEMNRHHYPKVAQPKQNLINPGILPKDPSLMKPGES